jgi:hypothetical protein
LRSEVRTEIVPFITIESARFEIRRPDTDGSLDWLYDDNQEASLSRLKPSLLPFYSRFRFSWQVSTTYHNKLYTMEAHKVIQKHQKQM